MRATEEIRPHGLPRFGDLGRSPTWYLSFKYERYRPRLRDHSIHGKGPMPFTDDEDRLRRGVVELHVEVFGGDGGQRMLGEVFYRVDHCLSVAVRAGDESIREIDGVIEALVSAILARLRYRAPLVRMGRDDRVPVWIAVDYGTTPIDYFCEPILAAVSLGAVDFPGYEVTPGASIATGSSFVCSEGHECSKTFKHVGRQPYSIVTHQARTLCVGDCM